MKEVTDTISLENDFSYELRVYCNLCDDEVGEYDQIEHRETCHK